MHLYSLIWITVIPLGSLFFAPLAIAQPLHHHHSATPPSSDLEAIAFAKGMDQSMATMMSAMHTAAVTGDPDLDFLAMMIPHHQGAIDMARLVLLLMSVTTGCLIDLLT
ncbi:MAG: DUF305 domain-containing protein [Oscillatoriales cyanobacterium C42_A2020_001]|nr:DUF305 domain-containing protein [Leptolyngbyaceae cyanobacterium C42_A2020_001]